MVMGWDDLLIAGVSMAANSQQAASKAGEALSQKHAAKRAAREEKSRYNARKEAYRNLIGAGKKDLASGEKSFLEQADVSLPELQMMKEQIGDQTQEQMQDTGAQIQAEGAKGGMRGGQLGTLIKRGVGEVGKAGMRDVNQMMYEEAAKRAGEKRGYFSGKARSGQMATYTPPTF